MIQLTRERTEKAIPKKFRGQARVNRNIRLLKSKKTNTLKFNSIWQDAKKQLKKESLSKCAYCESPTSTVAYGDVEHFRPKSIYWWLVYCYDNFLFSCQLCNQPFKSANFPLRSRRMQAPKVGSRSSNASLVRLAPFIFPDPLNDQEGLPLAKFIKQSKKELAALVNPYFDDPEPLFAWDADLTLEEVRIRPRSKSRRSSIAFKAVEQFYDLNREDLLKERFRVYKEIEFCKAALQDKRLSWKLKARCNVQLQSHLSNDAPYAGMARYFVRIKWRLLHQ
jgi:hypothetical protein